MTLRTLKNRIGIRQNARLLIGIGQFTLAAAILLGRLALHYGWTDFVEGMLLGISIVTNLAGLIAFGRQENSGGTHG